MQVLIKLSTTLREYVPEYTPSPGIFLPLSGNETVLDVALTLGLPPTEIKIVMVNGRHASLDTTVQDGDRVAYFPAVGGG